MAISHYSMNNTFAYSLTNVAGLPMCLTIDGEILFGADVFTTQSIVRRYGDLVPVLNKTPHISQWNSVAYLSFRKIGLQSDLQRMIEDGLRYDITVLQPGIIGVEYVKTFGHRNPLSSDTNWTYPQLHQVLSGRANFLIQRMGPNPACPSEFTVVECLPGEILLVPPFHYHAAVNPHDEPTVIASWVNRDCKPDYETIQDLRGLVYYEVCQDGASLMFPNTNYLKFPEPKWVRPVDLSLLGITQKISIYEQWKYGTDLSFLVYPEEYVDLWEQCNPSHGQEILTLSN
jgi:glucose-6-phosphate isomerase